MMNRELYMKSITEKLTLYKLETSELDKINLYDINISPRRIPNRLITGMSEGCSSTTSLNCIFGYTKGILSSLFPLFNQIFQDARCGRIRPVMTKRHGWQSL